MKEGQGEAKSVPFHITKTCRGL